MINFRVFKNPCVARCVVVHSCGQRIVFVALRSENVAACGPRLPLIIERSFPILSSPRHLMVFIPEPILWSSFQNRANRQGCEKRSRDYAA